MKISEIIYYGTDEGVSDADLMRRLDTAFTQLVGIEPVLLEQQRLHRDRRQGSCYLSAGRRVAGFSIGCAAPTYRFGALRFFARETRRGGQIGLLCRTIFNDFRSIVG